MNRKRKILRRCTFVAGVLLVITTVAFLIYFPGRQSLLAITLATGLGVKGLQEQVDTLEEKAIKSEPFTEADKEFLRNLYTCFAKGARLTVVLRQSAQLMEHYLSKTGEDLRIGPRVFLGSSKVQEQVAALTREIVSDLRDRNEMDKEYASPTFYMGDPEFSESYVGLYFGRVLVRPRSMENGTVLLQWRAEMPWQWPSYQSLHAKYGDCHAQCFPLPNARSVIQGPRYCLRMDDGLGEHLAQIGLAKPFMVYSEWEGHIEDPIDKKGQPSRPADADKPRG